MAQSTHTSVASATIPAAAPRDVLALLTAPEAIASWAPVPFEIDEIDGRRLQAGSRARVSGGLAGRRVAFDVDVHRADSNDGSRAEASDSGHSANAAVISPVSLR